MFVTRGGPQSKSDLSFYDVLNNMSGQLNSLLAALSGFNKCALYEELYMTFDRSAPSLPQVSGLTSPPETLDKDFIFSSSRFLNSTGAMNGLRKHFTMGLVLVMCTLTGHCGRSAPSVAARTAAAAGGGGRAAHVDLRRMVEIMKHVEDSRSRHSAKTESPLTSRAHTSPVDLRNLKTERGAQAVGEWLVVWVGPLCWILRGGCVMMDENGFHGHVGKTLEVTGDRVKGLLHPE